MERSVKTMIGKKNKNPRFSGCLATVENQGRYYERIKQKNDTTKRI